jgi:hypothetical protein
MENEQVLVERPTCLVPFDDLKDAITELKAKNEKMVFAYNTPQGEKDARSHCYQLRQTKSQITSIHKDAKSKALAECQLIDSEKNDLIGTVEEMINFHMKPINEIAKAKKAAAEALAEAEKAAAAEVETKRLAVIAENEAEAAKILEENKALQAKILDDEKERQAKIAEEERERMQVAEARQAAIDKVHEDRDIQTRKDAADAQKILDDQQKELDDAREKFEAEKIAEKNARQLVEDARLAEIKKARQEVNDALDKAERDKAAAVQAVKDEAARVEKERKVKEEAAQLREKQLAEADAKRKAKAEHRIKIDSEAAAGIDHYGGQTCDVNAIIRAIKDGKIPHVSITY